MRYAITTGIRHGHQAPIVITGPEVPLNVQRETFLKMRGQTEHPDFHKVELWTSDAGITRKARFSKPLTAAEKKEIAKAKEKAAAKTASKEKENEPSNNKASAPVAGDKGSAAPAAKS